MSEPVWLSDSELQAWLRVAATSLLLPSALDAQLQRDAGITHYDYLVLAMLSEAPNRTLRMSELAAVSNASLSRLSHVVSKLEKRGWVAKCPAPDDGRVSVATLTDAGWAKVVETAPGHAAFVRSVVFDGLTPEQVGQLYDIMGAMLTRLDPARLMSFTPP
ncbi:MarR family winged helix-turn-helix transcriptional regulator [soil metagenome]